MPNRLQLETSPYLLQHAGNPVDWYPWGEEALAKAREEDKPIFLSIGYAACHWCHVMERESFEDEATAALMNRSFVSIKVDREERPDLDGIYMDAVQAMNGQGGWPMSAFLTPDGAPFYAGTYFPPEPAHGMPAFRQVLEGSPRHGATVATSWSAQAGRVTEAIARPGLLRATEIRSPSGSRRRARNGSLRRPSTLAGAVSAARRSSPADDPGLRAPPGGPRRARRDRDAGLTLDRMADGGIYDHLGGGFARYSTDAAWHVPHFEKMLYDNAQLLRLYTRAWQVTRTDGTRAWRARPPTTCCARCSTPEGGFWSSQDADSEGVEGKFFAWTWDELVALVGEPVAACFGATPAGNWPDGPDGANVLWRPVSVSTVAREFGRDAEELSAELEGARRRLFDVRERRVQPATDDKVLTAWNALAIEALAEAGRVFDEPRYLEAAIRCGAFLRDHLRDDGGRLLRSWRRDRSGGRAFADDHALLVSAFLTLYETTFELAWFEAARELADALIERFADDERGGFFQTAADADPLLVRPKDLYDNAVPSGNSAAAEALLRLASFTAEARYEASAVSALGLVRDVLGRAPTAFGLALCALDRYIGPAREVAVVGDPRPRHARAGR